KECGCQRTNANYGERLYLIWQGITGGLRTVAEGGELLNGVPCKHRIDSAGDCNRWEFFEVDFILPAILPIGAGQEAVFE
ncbi:hypothetical protein WCE16_23235, partial [Atlantibacter hermannii]